MSTTNRPFPGGTGVRRPVPGTARRAARRSVQGHLLRVIAESPWGDGLILRGSLPLQAWVGAAAR
ncbi:hypothetical protein ACFXPY_09315 [Streptomyces sp. NPDC059153]|uniref:hypothetical protein n=1 Tax=Streptomyces sp. NPDC059153 TaxID=3346743 RepID=UPI0036A4DBFF